MIPQVEEYERCYWLNAYYGQECELCPYRNKCVKGDAIMICPCCGRRRVFNNNEREFIKKHGEYKTICYGCGTQLVARKQNIKASERRVQLKEAGICTNCGIRPATEGYCTCEKCRSYYYERQSETKSTGYYDLYYRGGIKKNTENNSKELEELSKEAYEKGISYGELVAIKEGRKKLKKDLD